MLFKFIKYLCLTNVKKIYFIKTIFQLFFLIFILKILFVQISFVFKINANNELKQINLDNKILHIYHKNILVSIKY